MSFQPYPSQQAEQLEQANQPDNDSAPPPPEGLDPAPRPDLRSRSASWRDVLEIVFLIAIIYAFVNLATARAIVEGLSMHPNFETGQLVIVNRSIYFFGGPERGDVIVLHNPRNANEDFIKRVVGLPNDIIEIKEGRVYANGTLLEEPYILKFCTYGCDGMWKLGADEYFVLGDNRPSSYDSHAFGPIKRSSIVGKAWVRYWPLADFSIIQHPDYGPIRQDYTPAPPTPTFTPAPVTPGPMELPDAPGA